MYVAAVDELQNPKILYLLLHGLRAGPNFYGCFDFVVGGVEAGYIDHVTTEVVEFIFDKETFW